MGHCEVVIFNLVVFFEDIFEESDFVIDERGFLLEVVGVGVLGYDVCEEEGEDEEGGCF